MTDLRETLAQRPEITRLLLNVANSPLPLLDFDRNLIRAAAAFILTPAAPEAEEWIRWCYAQADFLGLSNLRDLAEFIRRLAPSPAPPALPETEA